MDGYSTQLLLDAYKNFRATGTREYSVVPKNPQHILELSNAILYLSSNNYIDDISCDIYAHHMEISLDEPLLFSITDAGIEYVRVHRDL